MLRSPRNVVGAVVFLMLVAVLTAGCGGSKRQGDLVGWAIAGHPLAGATIEAVDSHGKVLATAPAKTLATGTWAMPLAGPPKSFTLVATGGTDNGRPFAGQLKLVVRDYDHRAPRALHLNPATTLVAHYLGENPKATTDNAVKKIATFLRIPQPLDLEADLRATDRYFSGAEFMRQAAAAGGIGQFVGKLDEELDAGKTHAFVGAPANQAGLGAALTGLQMLQGAGAGVSIISGIVGMVRGGQQTDELADIQTGISQLETDFSNLQSEMGTVLSTLNKLVTITQQSTYNNAISNKINLLITQLQTVYPLYQDVLQSKNGLAYQRDAAIQNFVNAVQPNQAMWDNTASTGLDLIYSSLVKQGGQTGALAAWADMAGTPATRFITYATQQRAAAAISFWVNVQTEVLAVDAAYEDAITNDPDLTTAIAGGADALHTTEAAAKYAGTNAKDAQSQCVPSGGSTTTGNNLLDELNASQSCFEDVLPDDTASSAEFQSNGVYPMTLVDQASGLMWQDWGGGNPDYYDPSGFVQYPSQLTAFPTSDKVASPGWRLPTLAELQTLASLDEGSWDVRSVYTGTLDMLANYANSPFFQRLQSDTTDSTLSEPGDFILTFWDAAGACTWYDPNYYDEDADEYGTTWSFCLHGTYDIGQNTAFMMCANAGSDTGDSQCTQVMDVDGDGYVDDNGYHYSAVFKSSHANDAADVMYVRTVGSTEQYGTPLPTH